MRYIIEGIDGRTGDTTKVKVNAQSGKAAVKIAAKHGITAKAVRRSRSNGTSSAALVSVLKAKPLPPPDQENTESQRAERERRLTADAASPVIEPTAWKPRRFFKVEIISGGGRGATKLGVSTMATERIDQVLNKYGAEGWELAFMTIAHRRRFLFWKCETVIMTFCRVY